MNLTTIINQDQILQYFDKLRQALAKLSDISNQVEEDPLASSFGKVDLRTLNRIATAGDRDSEKLFGHYKRCYDNNPSWDENLELLLIELSNNKHYYSNMVKDYIRAVKEERDIKGLYEPYRQDYHSRPPDYRDPLISLKTIKLIGIAILQLPTTDGEKVDQRVADILLDEGSQSFVKIKNGWNSSFEG